MEPDRTNREIAPGTPPPDPSSMEGRRIVAVIGIDRYDHWPPLQNAVGDAQGARALFLQLGFEELFPPLIDATATGEAIRRLVTDDLRVLGPNDSLVLFFAGHGHTRSGTFADGTVVKTGYLMPVDGADDKAASWLRIDSWMDDVSRLPAKHILVILDACHSGVALGSVIRWRGTPLRQDPLDTLRARRSRRVITSALDDELALDSGPVLGHSLFTGCLIEALTNGLGRPGQRVVTGSEIGIYLQRRVKEYPSSRQTPDVGTFELDDRGELVIPVLSPEPEPPPPPTTTPTPTVAAVRDTRSQIVFGFGLLGLAVLGVVAIVFVARRLLSDPAVHVTPSSHDARDARPLVDAANADAGAPVHDAVFVRGAADPRPLLGRAGTASDAFQPSAHITAPAASYWISSTEITWRELMAAMPRLEHIRGLTASTEHGPWLRERKQELRARTDRDADALPVTGIGWSLASAYCGLSDGELPTEEQWEWAARGESPTLPAPPPLRYTHVGDEWVREPGIAAVGTSPDDDVHVTGGVVHDLVGNVEEWTGDVCRDSETGAPMEKCRATRGFPPNTDTVARPAVEEGAAYRNRLDPDPPRPFPRHLQIGFRCVWEVP